MTGRHLPRWPATAAVAALALTAGPIRAHPWSVSRLTVRQLSTDTGARFHGRLALDGETARTLLHLDDDGDGTLSPQEVTAEGPAIERYVAPRLALRLAGQACPSRPAGTPSLGPGGAVIVERVLACPRGGGPLRITVETFTEDVGGHKIDATFLLADGVARHRFTTETPWYEIALPRTRESDGSSGAAPPGPGAGAIVGDLPRVLLDGVLHVLSGADHLLFVVALGVTLAGRSELLRIVTSFTVAHSLALLLASLDVVTLPGAIVEPLVALTLIVVAAENLRTPLPPYRTVLTFAFGLVHGLAFAEYFQATALPSALLVPLVVTFNVGVEIGQLVVLGPVALALARVPWLAEPQRRGDPRTEPPRRRWVRVGVSAMVGLCGVGWLVERTLLP